ncbi:MAG TPA: gamma-glutamyltransferase [Ferruginibacter sp.]|nr:gamma-glutamyltransferase [Ferruginibacter sp.]HMP20495.1 gamma-glutamyltransferase [Ferruginibacter sp.]
MIIRAFGIALFVFVYAQSTAQINPYHYRLQKNISVSRGAVVSAHPLASEVGVAILKKGGNAVDAAIAVQLALAVVYPGAGNIGGGGFMVAHLRNGKNIALDFRETAPAAASRDMYLDAAGNPQLQLSQDGHLSAGIPGTVAGLFASMKYAKLSFKTLIQPAISLAEKGFALTEEQAADFNEYQKEFEQLSSLPVAFVKTAPWKAGDTLIQKDLANTLKRIRDYGQKGFYEGETAKLIVAEMQKGRGIITLADLKNYTVKERVATEFDYKNHHIITMPLPSSGGIILQQMMGMIEDKNIAALGFQTAASVQLLTEVERRAYADRAEYLGDPDFVQVPVHTLVSKKYIAARMQDFEPGKAGSSAIVKAGNIKESEETTHLSVIDAAGNAVSVTTTLNGHFGSRTVVSGAGFLLNNEMDDFSIKPGVPNMYGAVGNEKNAIAPGKRMLSSMTPTIVLKNNKPYLVVGTPGGTTIPTSVFQTLVNIIEFGMNAEDAVNKPKFHHQWLPDIIYVEEDFDSNTASQLTAMGYTLKPREPIGRTELIQVQGKKIIAVGDKRGDDSAAGY